MNRMKSMGETDSRSNRDRCWSCFRPAELCFCDAIPRIENRTEVLIVQHRRERFHAFNTARIVRQSLKRCRLLTDNVPQLAERFETLDLESNVGLLFPSAEARRIDEVPPAERPEQIVVVDGTWHHARSLMREIPRLRQLPSYRLSPARPGRFRIRKEPDAHSLSTLEATVSALHALEPQTTGLDSLLAAFERMVDDQIDRSRESWRDSLKRKHRGLGLPRVLTSNFSKVVVAYGEQAPPLDKKSPNRFPVYLAAERLNGANSFRCAIHSPIRLEDDFLARLRLNRRDMEAGVPPQTFRQRWNQFLRDDDHLVMFHPSVRTLLQSVGADQESVTILKALPIDGDFTRGTLDEVVLRLGLETSPRDSTRAGQRLAAAIALVRHLHQQELTRPDLAKIDDAFLDSLDHPDRSTGHKGEYPASNPSVNLS